jgi:myo-inositol-1(or 4)-monophosphatase
MELETLCQQAILVVHEAADFIAQQAKKIGEIAVQEKSLHNLVSYVDVEAEKILVHGLQKLLPQAGFITEENSIKENATAEYVWVIDPLDGTTNFLHGLPLYCVSVGLLHKGKSILGIVHEVSSNETFYAWKNGGAFLNGNKITTRSVSDMNEALIVTGFFYNDVDVLEKFLNILRQMMKRTRGFRRLGSAALDLAYVAAGRCDAFYEFNLNSWDVAGGVVIVEEAGGIVSTFSKTDDYLFGKEIIASSKGIYNEALEIINRG